MAEEEEEEDLLYFPIDLLLFAPGVFTGSRNNISFRFFFHPDVCLSLCVLLLFVAGQASAPKKKILSCRWRDLICPFITRKFFLSFSLEPNDDDDDDETGRVCLFGKMRLTLTICWTSSRRWIDAIAKAKREKMTRRLDSFFFLS